MKSLDEMLWPVFAWEVRLDHCNGPSRSLAQQRLISFLTLNYIEKRKFKTNKSGSKILHILNICQDYQPNPEVFRGRSSAKTRSSINRQKLMNRYLVCRTGVGDSSGLTLSLGGLGNTAMWNSHSVCASSVPQLLQVLPREVIPHPLMLQASLPVFQSQQQSPGSDQEQQCHMSANHESYSLPEIHYPPSGPKFSIYLLQFVMITAHWTHRFVYGGDSLKCRTLSGRFFCAAPEMFHQYLPWLSDAAWKNMSSPVRSRKMSSPWLHRYWLSRKEPQDSTTCKMAMLKQQHLGFGLSME